MNLRSVRQEDQHTYMWLCRGDKAPRSYQAQSYHIEGTWTCDEVRTRLPNTEGQWHLRETEAQMTSCPPSRQTRTSPLEPATDTYSDSRSQLWNKPIHLASRHFQRELTCCDEPKGSVTFVRGSHDDYGYDSLLWWSRAYHPKQ